MNRKNVKLANLAAVLVSSNAVKTAEYYRDIMGPMSLSWKISTAD